MSWVLALIFVVGLYYILDLYFKHKETMAGISKKDEGEDQ